MLALGACAVTPAACGQRSGHPTIAMDGTSFSPRSMSVKVGDTVTWVNRDPFPHNVTSRTGGFRSGDVEPDERWELHATTPGTFAYECTLHPGMKATLVVKP